MNIKELKRLAAACRKAGISHFKSADYEFTLTEDQPVSAYKRTKAAAKSEAQPSGDSGKFESDTLTEEQLMFWSSGVTDEIVGEGNN